MIGRTNMGGLIQINEILGLLNPIVTTNTSTLTFSSVSGKIYLLVYFIFSTNVTFFNNVVGFNLSGATAESDFIKSGTSNVAKASGMYIKATGNSVTASLKTTGYIENYGFFAL